MGVVDWLAKDKNRIAGAESGLNRIRALLQGASFGFGDELESKFGDTNIEDIRGQMRNYSMQSPWENMLMNLVGGIPSGLGVSSLLKTNPAKLGSLIKDATIQSGAYGVGSGEGGALNRIKEGVVQGAQGAVLAPVLVGGGKALSGTAGLIKKLTGNQNIEKDAAQEIMKAAQADVPYGNPLQDILNKSSSAENLLRNKNVPIEPIFATYGGKNTEGLLRTTSGTPGRAATNASDMASDIKNDLGTYLENIIRSSITDPSDPNYSKLMNLKATRAQDVEPLYQQAFQNRSPLLNQDLLDIAGKLKLDPEVFTEAFKQAKRSGRDYPTKWIPDVDLPGKMTTGSTRPIGNTGFTEHEVFDPDLQFWDMVKRSLYQREKSGTTDPTSIRSIRKELMNVLDTHPDVDPIYQQARKTYTDESDVIAALEQGKMFKKMKPDELESYLGGLSTSAERESFMSGMVNSIIEQSNKSDRSSKAAIHSLLSPENREKLTHIIPNPQQYDEFIQSIEEISKIAGTADIMSKPGRSMLGSDAAVQEALQVAGAGSGVLSGLSPSSIANALARALRGHGMSSKEELNDTILRMITTNPEDLVPQLEQLLKPTMGEKASGLIKKAVPSITGTGTGLEPPSGYPEE